MLEKDIRCLEHEIGYLKKMNALLVKRVTKLEKADSIPLERIIYFAVPPIMLLALLVILLVII